MKKRDGKNSIYIPTTFIFLMKKGGTGDNFQFLFRICTTLTILHLIIILFDLQCCFEEIVVCMNPHRGLTQDNLSVGVRFCKEVKIKSFFSSNQQRLSVLMLEPSDSFFKSSSISYMQSYSFPLSFQYFITQKKSSNLHNLNEGILCLGRSKKRESDADPQHVQAS